MMEIKQDKKLCGGIFFSLICEAKQSSRPSHYFEGIKEQATEEQLFSALINMLTKAKYSLESVTKDKPVSLYKNCSKDTVPNLDLLSDEFLFSIKESVGKKHTEALNACNAIIQKLLKGHVVAELFCRRIITIILEDDSILDTDTFYFGEGLEKTTKAQIRTLHELYFEGIVFGTWYYILSNRIKNSDCLDAYNNWFKQHTVANSQHSLNNETFKLIENVPITILPLGELELGEKPTPIIVKGDKRINRYGWYITRAVAYHSELTTIVDPYKWVDLYSFYVSTSVCKYEGKETSFRDALTSKPVTPKNILDAFGNRICLVAQGGFGKSVFLRHMFLCEKRYGDDLADGTTGLIPILLNINEYGNLDLNIEQFAHRMISRFDHSISYDEFLNDLKNGRFLLLFDALDEIGGQKMYRFIRDINDFTKNYEKNSIILSSRLSSDAWPMLKDFTPIQLLPFDKYKIKRLINKFTSFDEKIRNSFIKRIENKNSLSAIEKNPLLLTIKFMVFAKKEEFLDAETYKFYQRAYEVLYDEHDQVDSHYDERKYKTGLSKRDLSKLIAEFSFYTFFKHIYAFDKTTINEAFECYEFEDKYNTTADDFVYDLVKNLCLFYEEEGKYKFIHRSFQEYFAALFMSQQKDDFFKEDGVYENLDKFSYLGHVNPVKPEQVKGLKGLKALQHFVDFTKPDDVYNMFFQMKPSKFVNCVLLPKLDYVFGNPENPYWVPEYILKAYEFIHYSVGRVEGQGEWPSLNSEILEYIFKEIVKDDYDFHEFMNIETDQIEDFLMTEYYITGYDKNHQPEFLEIHVGVDELDTSELEPDEVPPPSGKVYLIPMVVLLANEKKYQKLIDELGAEFLEEYEDFLKVYRDLDKKYRKK